MKKAAFSLIIFLITSVTVFNSCQKGNTGPAGEDGNANVISTDPITLAPARWVLDSNVWLAEFPVPAITADIVSKGAVHVYIKYGTQWWALPDINNGNATSYGFAVGKVELINANNNGATPLAPQTLTFRAVVVAGVGRSIAYSEVDFKDYNAVKKAFNLKD